MPDRPTCSVIAPFAGSASSLEAFVVRLARVAIRQGDELLVADNRPTTGASARSAGPVTVFAASGPAFAGMAWLQGRWPGASPAPGPRELAHRFTRPVAGQVAGWAREVGRLRSNIVAVPGGGS